MLDFGFLEFELDVVELVQGVDDACLDEIGNQVAVPDSAGCGFRHEPQHWNHGEREDERNEKRHAVVAVELVDDHEHIDVAEEDEAQRKHAQRMAALGKHLGLVAAKELGDALRPHPH